MKVLENTLKVKLERWDDPGDYPSNAGAGPLPSEDFVEDIEGHVLLKIDSGDDLDEFMGQVDEVVEVPENVFIYSWNIELLPDWTVKLTVANFTA